MRVHQVGRKIPKRELPSPEGQCGSGGPYYFPPVDRSPTLKCVILRTSPASPCSHSPLLSSHHTPPTGLSEPVSSSSFFRKNVKFLLFVFCFYCQQAPRIFCRRSAPPPFSLPFLRLHCNKQGVFTFSFIPRTGT